MLPVRINRGVGSFYGADGTAVFYGCVDTVADKPVRKVGTRAVVYEHYFARNVFKRTFNALRARASAEHGLGAERRCESRNFRKVLLRRSNNDFVDFGDIDFFQRAVKHGRAVQRDKQFVFVEACTLAFSCGADYR